MTDFGWLWMAENPGRILASALVTYVAVIALLRVSGKRTLAQLNIFDLIVTVAIGSLVATTVVSGDVSVLEGALGLGALVALQYLVALATNRVRLVRRLVRSDPRALLVEGRFMSEAMRRERVSEAEVREAVRQQGYAAIEEVGAVVLETNGRFSVLPAARGSALEGVDGIAEARTA